MFFTRKLTADEHCCAFNTGPENGVFPAGCMDGEGEMIRIIKRWTDDKGIWFLTPEPIADFVLITSKPFTFYEVFHPTKRIKVIEEAGEPTGNKPKVFDIHKFP